MRVLFLSPLVPHPQTDGGRQRVGKLLDALLDDHRVTYAGLSAGEDVSTWAAASRLAAAPLVTPSDRGLLDSDRSGEVARAAGVPWSARPKDLARREQLALWEKLSALPMDTFDVVHAEYGAMAPLAVAMKKREPALKLVLDLHNVEWHYKARGAANLGSGVGTAARRALDATRMFMLERTLYPQFDRVLVCSEADGHRLGGIVQNDRTTVVPNGTDTSAPPAPPASDSRRLVFVGSMSYAPNETAVVHFCEDVLPRIQRVIPDAEFWIVGRGPSDRVLRLAECPGVHVTGAVDDVRPYLAAAAAAVVPLTTGGGTRLKILEAMAAGRVVVATTVGIEGIDAVPGKDFLLADGRDECADRCVDLLRNTTLRDQIASAGRALVVSRYDWTVAQRLLRQCYHALDSAGR